MKTDSKVKVKENKVITIEKIASKNIVIQSSTAPNKKEINYLIGYDGIVEKHAEIEDYIYVCLVGSSDINWTQKRSLVDLVLSLQNNGAMSIKRYDEINNKEINPLFDLNNVMIKFNLK
jgi:hypothetical protein